MIEKIFNLLKILFNKCIKLDLIKTFKKILLKLF